MEIDIIRKYIPQHLEIPTIDSPQKLDIVIIYRSVLVGMKMIK